MCLNEIRDDFPLGAFVTQELTQVCIGLNHVRLSFYKVIDALAVPPKWAAGANIDIEEGFELLLPTGEIQRVANDTLSAEAGCLTSLLGAAVTSFTRLQKNELQLRFSNKSELRLRTNPNGFESYHLHVEGESVDIVYPQPKR